MQRRVVQYADIGAQAYDYYDYDYGCDYYCYSYH